MSADELRRGAWALLLGSSVVVFLWAFAHVAGLLP